MNFVVISITSYEKAKQAIIYLKFTIFTKVHLNY